MDLYDRLQQFASEENIIAGAGSAESFISLRKRLEGKEVPFVNYTAERRTEPSLTMSDVKSIVCIGLSYNTVYKPVNDGRLRGRISAGAVGEDYHTVIKRKLEKLHTALIPGCKAMIFSDTGPLSDRDVALRCSLGVMGKNAGIINPLYGGMFFIGYMLTDADFTEGKKECAFTSPCTDCDRCIKACPNSALREDGCDYARCISYITQKKGPLSDSEYEAMGTWIYGCDVCRRVCPCNSVYREEENVSAYPDIEKLLTMSDKEFRDTYRNTAAGWRGRRLLQRNALAVLGNLGDRRGLELVLRFADSESEALKSAAGYAIKKLERC